MSTVSHILYVRPDLCHHMPRVASGFSIFTKWPCKQTNSLLNVGNIRVSASLEFPNYNAITQHATTPHDDKDKKSSQERTFCTVFELRSSFYISRTLPRWIIFIHYMLLNQPIPPVSVLHSIPFIIKILNLPYFW